MDHQKKMFEKKILDWSSDLTEDEHLIRSSILEIHAYVEAQMKTVLYQHMLGLIPNLEDAFRIEQRKKLFKTISDMNFSTIHRLLKPCFDSVK